MDQDTVPIGDGQHPRTLSGVRPQPEASGEASNTHKAPRRSAWDMIQSANAEDEWKIFPVKSTVAICHGEGCDQCDEYVGHLLAAIKNGSVELASRDIVRALDKAWPALMEDVRKDARAEVVEDYRRLDDKFNDLQKSYDKEYDEHGVLLKKYAAMEEKLAQYEGKGKRKAGESTPPDAPAGKRRATEIPSRQHPVTVRPPSPEPEEDSFDMFHDGTDSDDPPPRNYSTEASTSGHNPAHHGPRGRRSRGVRSLPAPDYVRPTRPIASQPIAVTGVLPTPLGRTTAASNRPRPRGWFDTCDIESAEFQAALARARSLPNGTHSAVDHAVLNRATRERKRANRVPAFAEEPTLPAEMQEWINKWANNPEGTPCPIRDDEHGRLSIPDIDVWLWSKKVTPPDSPKAFRSLLWGIFKTPGQWREMAGTLPASYETDNLRSVPQNHFVWTRPVEQTTPQEVARWCAIYGGVTPDRACEIIEPYAVRLDTGRCFNEAGRVARERAKQTAIRRGKRRPSPPPAASLRALAARIDTAPPPESGDELPYPAPSPHPGDESHDDSVAGIPVSLPVLTPAGQSVATKPPVRGAPSPPANMELDDHIYDPSLELEDD
jgi:hypothetical protein